MKRKLTWDQLAKELCASRRTLLEWRKEHPDAPKDRDPEKWRAFMADRGLHHHNFRKNAPPPPAEKIDAAAPSPLAGSNSDVANRERLLRLQERELDLQTAQLKLGKQQAALIPVVEVKSALMQTFIGISGGLKQLPGRAADKIAIAARTSLRDALRAAVTPKQFENIATVLETASVNYGTVTRILDDEIDELVRTFGAGEFLKATPGMP